MDYSHIEIKGRLDEENSEMFCFSYEYVRKQKITELLDETMKTASVKETFVETALSQQLEQVAKLIDIKDKRGVDRDIFYASMPEWVSTNWFPFDLSSSSDRY